MRLRYLQALRAVMETGTVTEAAMRMHRTQPQISRLIASLEEELGFDLFARHKRRLVPTREGRVFYQEAERILAGYDEISNIIRDIRRMNEPRLRIAAQSFLAQSILPDALAAFTRREPALRYTIDIVSRAEIDRAFRGQAVDLGLAALPVGHEQLLRTQPFATARVVAVLPRGHRLARKSVLDARDLAQEPFIALKPYTLLRKEIDRLFTELGLHLNIRGEVSSGAATCRLVAEGLGVTIADPLMSRRFVANGVVIRDLEPAFTLTYGFLFPLRDEPSSLTLKFVETVIETALRLDPDHVVAVSGAGRERRELRRPRRA